LRDNGSKTVAVWNLGIAGASNDYIARMLSLAVPRLDPHIVLVNFTHLERREYISADNQLISYGPWTPPDDEVAREIFGLFDALVSPHDDQRNFFMNYKMTERTLVGRVWLFSNSMPHDFDPISDQMDLRRFVGQLSRLDRARDGSHPGPQSHKKLADRYWARFQELGGTDSIAF
jgi:hypothetical protein